MGESVKEGKVSHFCVRKLWGKQNVTLLCAKMFGEAMCHSFVCERFWERQCVTLLCAKIFGRTMCHTFVCERVKEGKVSHVCVPKFWGRQGVTLLCANVLGEARCHTFVWVFFGGGSKVSHFIGESFGGGRVSPLCGRKC